MARLPPSSSLGPLTSQELFWSVALRGVCAHEKLLAPQAKASKIDPCPGGRGRGYPCKTTVFGNV